MTDKYEEKYLKYKQKYLELKNQIGGIGEIIEIAPEAKKAAAEKAASEAHYKLIKEKADAEVHDIFIKEKAVAAEKAAAAEAQASAESHAAAEALYRSTKLTVLPDGTTFKCFKCINKQGDTTGLKTGVIVGKTNETNNLQEIIYKVVFFGEDNITTLKRSEITPTGIAGLAAAADLAKKNTVIGVVKAASAAVSAANTAVDTYKKVSPKVYQGALSAANTAVDTYKKVSPKVYQGALSAANTAVDTYKKVSPKVYQGALSAAKTAADTYKKVSPKVYQGAISAASKTASAASAAAEAAKNTYNRFSPKIAANLKQGATAVAAAASSAASAAASAAKKTPGIFESIGNAFTNKTTAASVASEPLSQVAPPKDLNTTIKGILDASEY